MKLLGSLCLILSAWLLIPSIGFESWFGALCFGIFLTTWARPINHNDIHIEAELDLDGGASGEEYDQDDEGE